jgi:hypothetical protein
LGDKRTARVTPRNIQQQEGRKTLEMVMRYTKNRMSELKHPSSPLASIVRDHRQSERMSAGLRAVWAR